MTFFGAISSQLSLGSSETTYFQVLNTMFPQNAGLVYAQDILPVFESNENQKSEVINNDYFSISDHNSRLLIGSINVEGPIVGGTSEATMKKGFWHYPSSSASFKYGNTVLIGHRYLKVPPHKDTFFNLDRVSIGDGIKITTNSGDLEYVVIEKKVINVTDTWILGHKDEPTLTLITCHPLWTSKQRLVIISRLVKSSIEISQPKTVISQ